MGGPGEGGRRAAGRGGVVVVRGSAAESASGREKKEKEEHWRGNGRGEREEASEKPGAQLQTAMGIFETTDRPPPHAISFLRLALFRPLFYSPRRAAAHDRLSTSVIVDEENACVHVAFVYVAFP